MDEKLEQKRQRAKVALNNGSVETSPLRFGGLAPVEQPFRRHLEEYHDALEAEVLLLKSRLTYLEGKVQHYERHLGPIGLLPHALPHLRPHPLVQKPLMQFRNGFRHGPASPSDDDALLVVEDLAEPPPARGAEPVEVHAEPEPLFETTSIEYREKLGGLDVERAGDGHAPPKMGIPLDYLTAAIERIRTQIEDELAHEYTRVMKALGGSDARQLADLYERWKVDAVRKYVARLKEAMERRQ